MRVHFVTVRVILLIFALGGAACSKQSDSIVAITLHPTNPKILYRATNESVY